jgi:hypothetical protein
MTVLSPDANTIRVTQREVYGNTLYYPLCSKSELFCELTQKVTLTERAMMLIRQLGYTIEVVPYGWASTNLPTFPGVEVQERF